MANLNKLSCPPSLVWSPTRARDLRTALHSHRYCHGHHKPAQQYLPHMPTRLRRPLPRSSSSKHGLRNLRLHILRARHKVLFRPKTRPLHEDPTPNPLLRPNGGNHRLIHYPNRSPQLDVHLRTQHLYARSTQRLHMPYCQSAFQRQHPLGRRRAYRVLRPRRNLPPPRLVFPPWCHRAHPTLALQPQAAQ